MFGLVNGGIFILALAAATFGDKVMLSMFAQGGIVGFVITIILVIRGILKQKKTIKTAI